MTNDFVANPNKKKSKFARNIIICLVLLFFVFPIANILFWIFIGTPAPPTPEITYGEFPFRIEYEIDGERFVFEDVLIAEFLYSSGGTLLSNPQRIWDTRLDSEGEREPNSTRTYDPKKFLFMETENLSITFNPGLAEFYMGDLGSNEGRTYISIGPNISVRTVTDGKVNVEYFLSDKAFEVLAKHGITLISWETAKPIVNSFKK